MKNVDVFENYMSTLRVIRNLCAHGHNIYDLKLQKRIRKGPIKELDGSMLYSLAGGLQILSYILSFISENRVQELRYRLNLLVSQPKIARIKDVINDLITFIKR